MIRIGVVDIDTSHPQAWIDILNRGDEARYVAVYDSGDVWDRDHVNAFAGRNELEVCGSIEEMVPQVDIGFIQGCDWDRHLERATPFLRAGKPVLIDKPVFGNLKDILKAAEWVEKGAEIVGGSSVRYARETVEFLAAPADERGETVSVFASTPAKDDPFSYSIHGVEMFQGLLGPGAESVRFMGCKNGVELFEVMYGSGVPVTFQRMTPFHAFAMTVTTTKGIHHIRIDSAGIYAALLERIVDYMRGKKDALVGFEAMAEPVKVMLAMKKSKEKGARVRIEDLSPSDEGYDGAAFAAEYRLSKTGG